MTSPAPYDDFAPAHTFNHDGFDATVYLLNGRPGLFIGHVDVHEGGVHKCRIVLVGQLDHGAAIVALEGKCRNWIAARERGEAAGNNRFDTH